MRKSLFCAVLLLSLTIAATPSTERRPSVGKFLTMTVLDASTQQQITNGETINEKVVQVVVTATTAGVDCYDVYNVIAGGPHAGFPQIFSGFAPMPIGPDSGLGDTVSYTSLGIEPPPYKTVTITVSTMCTGLNKVDGATLTFYDLYKP